MAEFHFYGSNRDTIDILKAITKEGDIGLTPNLKSPTPHPASHTSINDGLLEALALNPGLYVTGPFSRWPIRLREVTSGAYAGTYELDHQVDHVIDDKYGGPAFRFTVPLCLLRECGLHHLCPGDVFRQRQFYDESRCQHYPPPPEFVRAYEEVVRRVKSVAKRKRIGDHTMWIAPKGYELLQCGRALILWGGNWLDFNGRIVKSNLRDT